MNPGRNLVVVVAVVVRVVVVVFVVEVPPTNFDVPTRPVTGGEEDEEGSENEEGVENTEGFEEDDEVGVVLAVDDKGNPNAVIGDLESDDKEGLMVK